MRGADLLVGGGAMAWQDVVSCRGAKEAGVSVDGMVVVKTETHHLAADNVAAFLQAQGIDAEVRADDASGTLPSLDGTRFVHVLVPEAQAEEAKRLLAAQEAESPNSTAADDDEDDGD